MCFRHGGFFFMQSGFFDSHISIVFSFVFLSWRISLHMGLGFLTHASRVHLVLYFYRDRFFFIRVRFFDSHVSSAFDLMHHHDWFLFTQVEFPNSCISSTFGLAPMPRSISLHMGRVSWLTCFRCIWPCTFAMIDFSSHGSNFSTHASQVHLALHFYHDGFLFTWVGFPDSCVWAHLTLCLYCNIYFFTYLNPLFGVFEFFV